MTRPKTFAQTAIPPKMHPTSESWWIGCDRETFQERQQKAQERMAGQASTTNYQKAQSTLDT